MNGKEVLTEAGLAFVWAGTADGVKMVSAYSHEDDYLTALEDAEERARLFSQAALDAGRKEMRRLEARRREALYGAQESDLRQKLNGILKAAQERSRERRRWR